MARPRLIADEAIIAEAYELLMAYGPSKLTFEQLGARVGLVPAALVRRFKTKQQLMAEIDRYAVELTDAKVQEAMSKTSSAIDAILAQFTTELAFASTVDRFANGQEFLLMDFRNKNLYTNYQISYEHRHEQIIALLQQAQETGELEGVTDMSELARHLEMILHGSGHVWAMTQEGPIDSYISHHVDLALKPYRKQKKETT
jgi:AcrR family transcriptional regulator